MKRNRFAWILFQLLASHALAQKGPTTFDWPVYGGNIQGWHYSPDSRINADSLRRSGGLALKWSFDQIPRYDGPWFHKHSESCKDGFHETMQDTPEVSSDELFVATWHHLYAFDTRPKPGSAIQPRWIYSLSFENYSCTGYLWSGPYLAASATNRGVAIDKGVLYATTLDGQLIALKDLKKPKPQLLPGFPINLLDLKTRTGIPLNQIPDDQSQSYSTSSPPIVYDGKVIVGVAGGDGLDDGFIQGFVTAIDPHIPEVKWIFCTVPGLSLNADSPLGNNVIGCTDDKSQPATWPSNKAGREGGGAVWMTPTIDPSHGLILFGTGNPVGSRKDAAGEIHRSAYTGDDRSGTNLFTDSIVALDSKGRLRSYYQEVHHDLWDYDQASPIIAIKDKDIDILGAAGKTGWWYQFDAGKFTRNDPGSAMFDLTGKQETAVSVHPAYQHAWPTQPEPAPAYNFIAHRMNMFAPPIKPVHPGDTICISPGTFGGAEWGPVTYDRQTGRIYLIDVEEPTSYASTTEGAHRPPCIGVNDPKQSYIRAIDPHTGKVDPNLISEDLGEYPGGLLSTAGGLIFVGTRDGRLRAYDTSLKLVWSGCVENVEKITGCQFTITAAPMSFTIRRTQYIAITAMSIAPGGNSAVFVYGLRGK
ncbi:PQQ-binding-like beta-propeller repeat protein [Acidicapsa acidisoli]|uniref:PQQ-binding-like beta-propeller repeat protein n=1 Tax=Acidicapsa acidisoli TaxID=1615681 RepID=UPI0021E07B2C|nr:PQQ-binding-like beta-propeller repeat protein [Acidicapsa acidisoli]